MLLLALMSFAHVASAQLLGVEALQGQGAPWRLARDGKLVYSGGFCRMSRLIVLSVCLLTEADG